MFLCLGTILVWFKPLVLLSQTLPEDTILYHAYYEVSHIVNKDRPNDTLKDRTLLLVGQRVSQYTSYDKLCFGVEFQRRVDAEQSKVKVGDEPYKMELSRNHFMLEDYFFDHGDSLCYIVDYLQGIYMYNCDYPVHLWTTSYETKTILGLVCQKASTTFGGREWTVWFAPEIPTQSGPWQLHGLPGLIVEAHDLHKEICFSLKALESVASINTDSMDPALALYIDDVVRLPTDIAIYIQQQNFLRMKHTASTNPRAFLASLPEDWFKFVDYQNIFGMLWVSRSPIRNPFIITD